VDANRPKLNWDLVFQIKDVLGINGKTYYDGFEMLHQLGVPWVLDGMYKARLFSSNSVFLKIPA
jgi:hypothetical protein